MDGFSTPQLNERLGYRNDYAIGSNCGDRNGSLDCYPRCYPHLETTDHWDPPGPTRTGEPTTMLPNQGNVFCSALNPWL